MTYPLILIPFVLAAATVTAISASRPGFARRIRASLVAAIALFALTAVFDNVMIAVGLFGYPPEHLSGLRIGLAPLEDFAYPLCAAFGVPAVACLLQRSHEETAR